MQELDSALYMWFQARCSEGKAVSGPALIDKAKKMKKDLGTGGGECNFSVGWLRNFKERHGYLVLTLPKKTELVKHMERGGSRAKLMAEYGVGSSTLYNLKKQKDKLLSFVASTEGPTDKIQKRKTLRGPKMQELDSALYMWFQARCSEGKAVSGQP